MLVLVLLSLSVMIRQTCRSPTSLSIGTSPWWTLDGTSVAQSRILQQMQKHSIDFVTYNTQHFDSFRDGGSALPSRVGLVSTHSRRRRGMIGPASCMATDLVVSAVQTHEVGPAVRCMNMFQHATWNTWFVCLRCKLLRGKSTHRILTRRHSSLPGDFLFFVG